ncbi:MAG: hypothetical protein OH319_02640 [Candidatus Parvarchaeota archaeon]|nr:hypothetical protein [Candidatus Jingweiarchaeum tengchongense]MCW1298266.1 hypothetical protein [Candidatus Jingweiarchaeum tengchongense]MCW1300357.1 hypothetical protein [Candidatus Jingweiarchaeum tengchongense]MCW1304798.1 hypothetical protein [Candidatus Jingweiarchaeum tengchongense]MCW1305388.1 hypothetical protein [Candidatus Jingweiarchaeum tengchongense]
MPRGRKKKIGADIQSQEEKKAELVESRIFYSEDFRRIAEDEMIKGRGFTMESAKTLGVDKPGYYFLIKAEKEFFDKCEILKNLEEVKGDEKEKLLQKFKEVEESVTSGVGLLGI